MSKQLLHCVDFTTDRAIPINPLDLYNTVAQRLLGNLRITLNIGPKMIQHRKIQRHALRVSLRRDGIKNLQQISDTSMTAREIQ